MGLELVAPRADQALIWLSLDQHFGLLQLRVLRLLHEHACSSLLIHELIHLTGIRDGHLNEPRLALRIFVHLARRVCQD